MSHEVEVIWRNDPDRDFLEDVKSFAKFLDYYQIRYDLTQENEEKFVYLEDGRYRVSSTGGEGAFPCPDCGKMTFEIIEGDFDAKQALGLCCLNCDSYGAVFPAGL